MLKLLKTFMLAYLIGCVLVECKKQCYKLKFLNFRSNDTPEYRLSLLGKNQHSLMAVTRVLKAVELPIWHLQIHQYPVKRNQPPKVLFNGTYKTCEFWKYVKQINIVNVIAEQVLSKGGSNMSLECPLPVGTYVFQNIQIPSDTGLLRYMYWPNTLYKLYGVVYSQLSNKSLQRLCDYEVNSTVTKSC